jgi:hypothetical protein
LAGINRAACLKCSPPPAFKPICVPRFYPVQNRIEKAMLQNEFLMYAMAFAAFVSGMSCTFRIDVIHLTRFWNFLVPLTCMNPWLEVPTRLFIFCILWFVLFLLTGEAYCLIRCIGERRSNSQATGAKAT